ncbi:hypothetical protein ABW20_dc0101553 [Dactylellina cionopaga]|nr:hypothetical protein ABW20_dc0101553 [Dactylellina cionopaga]
MSEHSTPTRELYVPATSPYGSPEPLSDVPQPFSPESPLQKFHRPEYTFAVEITSSGPRFGQQDEATILEESSSILSIQDSVVESTLAAALPSESSPPFEASPTKHQLLDPTQEDEHFDTSIHLVENEVTGLPNPVAEAENVGISTLPTIAESPPPVEPTVPSSSPPRIPSPISSATTTPSVPAAKRRRLNSSLAAGNKLMQPFKSPLKINNAIHNSTTASESPRKYPTSTPTRRTALPYTPLRPILKSAEETEESEEVSPVKSTPLPNVLRSAKSTSKSINPPFRSSLRKATKLDLSSPSSHQTKDPYILSLEQKHTQLRNAVREAKKHLDESSQALKIEQSGEDAKLEELIIKWRQAAQNAADHMYSSVEQRFARMGGMAGYRERQNRKGGGGWGFSEDDPEEGLTDEQKDARRQAIYEAGFDEASELEKSESEAKNTNINDDGDQFTMDMMLKSLNIDVDIMGYDKNLQRWEK